MHAGFEAVEVMSSAFYKNACAISKKILGSAFACSSNA